MCDADTRYTGAQTAKIRAIITQAVELVIGISGSTGVIYGIRMLEVLRELGIHTHLIMSEWGAKCIPMETSYTAEQVASLAGTVSGAHNMAASVSSGTHRTGGMIIAPCSMKTLSSIANGYDETLLSRAAGVTIKESRKLVLMARESPLSAIHLENMLKLARLGVVILPPMAEFYTRPGSVSDMVDHGVGKCLDQFGIEHDLYPRWGKGPADSA
ncbi:3-polyprenyl-4-hydroxybenzoate decarboxylase [Cenarchaeum symbiosum A]|uniref:Flavin prenyltransferase UbiX n=1 Tax=Cenarchaeum symbiosum (strain A) TaxID=414004 RepID=A0RW17_CENSY|nr:3-polyprenyl-4-hydroxybenzoate decarboxylase [Cenarchaeum symbiosum A]